MIRTNLAAIIVIVGFMIIKRIEATKLKGHQLFMEDKNYRNDFDRMHYSGVNPIEQLKKYHIISNVTVTFRKATEECRKRNMMLATVRSVEHNDKLLDLLNRVSPVDSDKRFWIGGEYLRFDNGYYWSYCGDKFHYTNWAKGQPRFAQNPRTPYTFRNCVVILPSSNGCKWSLNDCYKKNAVVCEDVAPQPARQFRNMTYIFGEKKLSIEDAILECRRNGAYLASLETMQERTQLRKFMEKIDNPEYGIYWIHNGDNNSNCDYYHSFPMKPKCHRVIIRNDDVVGITGSQGCAESKKQYALCEKQIV